MFSTPIVSSSSSLLANAVFMSFHRIAWSLALSYIIFACENLQSGSIVRWLLSHPYWKPIGTMGLSLYITHVIYMMIMMMNQRESMLVSIWSMVNSLNFALKRFSFLILLQLHLFSGDLFPCIAIATFFYLAFECPLMLVEDFVYKKFTKTE
jgi:hypothetical protein